MFTGFGVEYAVIGIYMLFLIGIGFAFRRMNKNVDDYFRNGCQGTWWLVGMSAFMATTGAGTFVAGAGVNYEAGFTAYSYGFVAWLSWVLLAFVAHWFRQMRCITFPEVVEKRYGTGLQQFYAYSGIFMGLLGSGIQLWALCAFCSSVFGFPLQTTIVIMGAIVVTYSVTGGSWAVMGTDFIQGVVMVPMLFLLAVLCWIKVGGFGGFADKMAELNLAREWALIKEPGVFPGNSYTASWLLAMALLVVPAAFSMGSVLRFVSVKDGRDAKKSQWFAVALCTLATLTWCIPAFVARLLYHDEVMATDLSKPAESAIAVISTKLLPDGMLGLMVVAIFAAGMSTLDTAVNRNAAVIVQDIYPVVCRIFGMKEGNARYKLVLGVIFSIFSGVLLVLLALYFASREGVGVFETMMRLVALLGTPMGAPLIMGMFLKRIPQWSGLFAIGCGFVISLLSYLVGLNVGTTEEPVYALASVATFFADHDMATIARILDGPWSFAQTVISIWTVSHLSFFLTMPFYKREKAAYKEKVSLFFRTMHTPVDFEKEIGEEKDLSQLKIIGAFTCTIGLFVTGLLWIPNPLWGRVCILALALSVLGIGVLLLSVGRRYEKKRRERVGDAD